MRVNSLGPGFGCNAVEPAVQAEKTAAVVDGATVITDTAVYGAAKSPKYVFLFIGDGMSYPQFQAAADYLGAVADKDYMQAKPSVSLADRKGAKLDGPKALNFMNFDVAGSAVTYDSCSFAPDSASTATSIATGYKTYSGMINVDETGTKKYETIAETLHAQKGWKVGVVSSVNLNHATPAAFYAHQASRNDYYEIGVEMVKSGFEYFAGGALKKPDGADGGQENLYDMAEAAGYKVTYTQADAEKVTAADQKVILIDGHLADSDAMKYELDRTDGEWALADYDTYLSNLASQKISHAQFDEQYVANHKKNKTPFETAMKDVEKLFGLKMTGEAGDKLVLTGYEIQRLKDAYGLAMTDYDSGKYTQEQYVLYGTYDPFSVTITHILNNKSGIDFTSYSHTGLPVAVFADGVGADSFKGYYDNTAIYTKMASLLKVK